MGTRDEDMGPALTDEETELFNAVTSGEYSNFALMRGYFDDKPVAMIVSMHEGDNGEVDIAPLYVEVQQDDDEFMARLGDSWNNKTKTIEEWDEQGGIE